MEKLKTYLLLFSIVFFAGLFIKGTVPLENIKFMDYFLLDLSEVEPLFDAHAHNDYEKANPLFNALTLGFGFIETDVHLINDELFLYHKRPSKVDSEKTLTQQYLEPLHKIYLANNNTIFPKSDGPVYLVVDIKTNGLATYQKLMNLIEPYQSMFTHWENDCRIPGAITILITGNRPIDYIVQQKERWVCIDGRIKELGKNYSAELMPTVSERYNRVLGFHLFSKYPSQQKMRKLDHLSTRIKAEGKRLRLWRSPENESLWGLLKDSGADIISTDQPNRLFKFLRKRKK